MWVKETDLRGNVTHKTNLQASESNQIETVMKLFKFVSKLTSVNSLSNLTVLLRVSAEYLVSDQRLYLYFVFFCKNITEHLHEDIVLFSVTLTDSSFYLNCDEAMQ